ncbi:MAG TPA: carboxypeptidase-like regulatory domain-containing protein, partial [Chitinophagaceae bacterium]|nr:carboxypeptidase-like regulatory domain-containing protein [Chitinophagaceae bacterium]
MVTKRLLCVRIVLFCLLIILAHSAWSQGRVVTGKVTDSRDGSPVAGASVIPKGSSKGTSTNSEGDFRLTVPAN